MKEEDLNPSIVAVTACAGVLVFGMYRLWRIIQLSRRITAAKTWPSVEAGVISREALERRSRKSAASYSPVVKYKYTFMQQIHEGQVTLPGLFTRAGAEEALVGIGATIEVRCDPQNPARHVSAYDKVNIVDVVLLVVMLGLAVFLLTFYFL
jgi:hypothetical protein